MAALEALLRRDYELRERKSLPLINGSWANLHRHFKTFDVTRGWELSVRYALARRAEGAANATIRNEIALLSRSLTLAARHGLIPVRPLLARPSVRNARQGFVTPEEIDRLLDELSDPIRDVVLFAYVTGWRKSEILGLTWDRVEDRLVRLNDSKNGGWRIYPVAAHPKLRRMLELRSLVRRGPYVFHRSGEQILWFDHAWKSACRRAGLGHTLFHDLRRSAVRNMERAGVPRTVAMQLIGHKTESIYRRYAITNEEDLERGVRLLAALETDHRIRNGAPKHGAPLPRGEEGTLGKSEPRTKA